MKSRSTLFIAPLAAACALLCGCASPPLPRDFEPSLARIVAATTDPKVDVSGLPGGKPAGAGIGATSGSGIGVLAGVAACAPTGPLLGVCLATVLPATTVVGAVSGGAIGAVRTESTEALAAKRKTLADELSATPYQQRLSHRLQQDSDIAGASSLAAEARPWTLEAGIVEVGTDGKSTFALRLTARMQLRQEGATPVWQTTRVVRSATELTLSQWLAEDSKALRGVLDRCVDQAADELAGDLAASPVDGTTAEASRVNNAASCDDTPLQDGQQVAAPAAPAPEASPA